MCGRLFPREPAASGFLFKDPCTVKVEAVSYSGRSWPWHSGRNEFKLGVVILFDCWDLRHSLRSYVFDSRSRWPRGLRHGSAAPCLLALRFRIPPGAWMFVSCECCVFQIEFSASGRSLVKRSPTKCCVRVWSWSHDNQEALAHWGLLRHWKRKLFGVWFNHFVSDV
jgi:hypothetical protein